MSKKIKKNVTQKQMLDSVMNNPIIFEDAKICKQLLVAYMHENTEGLSAEEKQEFANEFIFPLRHKIDLFFELDRLNNIEFNATYLRLRKLFIHMDNLNVEDYFKLVALVEILLISYHKHVDFDDDTLELLATIFVYNTNITYELIRNELGNTKKL